MQWLSGVGVGSAGSASRITCSIPGALSVVASPTAPVDSTPYPPHRLAAFFCTKNSTNTAAVKRPFDSLIALTQPPEESDERRSEEWDRLRPGFRGGDKLPRFGFGE